MNGAIGIIEKRCPNCGHDRAWDKPKGVSCSRCGVSIEVKVARRKK